MGAITYPHMFEVDSVGIDPGVMRVVWMYSSPHTQYVYIWLYGGDPSRFQDITQGMINIPRPTSTD